MSDFKQQIANTLKTLRADKGLSLDATAKLTGVSKANLGQIERRETSPTIATLWKIASGLNTSFSSFFANEQSLRVSERVFPSDANMQITTLFPFSSDSNMEMFDIRLSEHHSQTSSPHASGVIEHIIVLEGELGVFFDQNWHALNTGESIKFYSDQAHGYKAITPEARFQNIVCYPK